MQFKAFIDEGDGGEKLRRWEIDESKKYVAPAGWALERKTFIEYLEGNYHTVKFLPNGSLHLTGDLNLIDTNLASLPCKIGRVEGNAKLQGNRLSNFDWADDLAVYGHLELADNEFESFHDIAKKIKFVNNNLNIKGNPLKKAVLGLLLFPYSQLWFGLSWGGSSGIGRHRPSREQDKVLNIINRYHRSHSVDHASVIDCQSELIDAGFDEWAEF